MLVYSMLFWQKKKRCVQFGDAFSFKTLHLYWMEWNQVTVSCDSTPSSSIVNLATLLQSLEFLNHACNSLSKKWLVTNLTTFLYFWRLLMWLMCACYISHQAVVLLWAFRLSQRTYSWQSVLTLQPVHPGQAAVIAVNPTVSEAPFGWYYLCLVVKVKLFFSKINKSICNGLVTCPELTLPLARWPLVIDIRDS